MLGMILRVPGPMLGMPKFARHVFWDAMINAMIKLGKIKNCPAISGHPWIMPSIMPSKLIPVPGKYLGIPKILPCKFWVCQAWGLAPRIMPSIMPNAQQIYPCVRQIAWHPKNHVLQILDMPSMEPGTPKIMPSIMPSKLIPVPGKYLGTPKTMPCKFWVCQVWDPAPQESCPASCPENWPLLTTFAKHEA